VAGTLLPRQQHAVIPRAYFPPCLFSNGPFTVE
jgi:hypothetical protein